MIVEVISFGQQCAYPCADIAAIYKSPPGDGAIIVLRKPGGFEERVTADDYAAAVAAWKAATAMGLPGVLGLSEVPPVSMLTPEASNKIAAAFVEMAHNASSALSFWSAAGDKARAIFAGLARENAIPEAIMRVLRKMGA